MTINFSSIKEKKQDSVIEFLNCIRQQLDLKSFNSSIPLLTRRSNPTPNKYGVDALASIFGSSISREKFLEIRKYLTKELSGGPKWSISEDDWLKYYSQALEITKNTNEKYLSSDNKLKCKLPRL